jgi:hypothetical protein
VTRAAFAIAALLATSCIAPSVVDSAGRAVATKAEDLTWRDAESADLRGLFESTSIEGEVAASLWRVYYHFAEDGTYTGAALVVGGVRPEFQTLSGTWTLAGGVLDLGEGQTARASAAPEHLRLASGGGVVILRRAAVE